MLLSGNTSSGCYYGAGMMATFDVMMAIMFALTIYGVTSSCCEGHVVTPG